MSSDNAVAARALTVQAGGRTFGIPLASIREIVADLRLMPLAGAPDRVLGLAGFRGEPLVVIGLAKLAGGAAVSDDERTIVVIDLGTEGSLGLAVGEVGDVVSVDSTVAGEQSGMFVRREADSGPVEVLRLDRMRAGSSGREA